MMTEDGEMVGSISGGCLESDLFGWTEQAIKEASPLLKNYDLSEDEVWSLGIGCKGSLEILILPVEEKDPFWKKTDELLNKEEKFSLIMEVPSGLRVLVNKNGYDSGRWGETKEDRRTTYIEYAKLRGNYFGFHGNDARNRLNEIFSFNSANLFNIQNDLDNKIREYEIRS